MYKQKAKQSASRIEKNGELIRKKPNKEKLADDKLELVSGGTGLSAAEKGNKVLGLRGDHFA